MLTNIQKQMTAIDADKMSQLLQQLEDLMTGYNVGLSNEQRTGLRTMAEGREGYAKLVSDIALTHTESLPRNENPEDLKGVLAYYSQLSQLRLKAGKFLEMLDDTQTAAGTDVMAMVDRYTNYLQTARKSNTALDMALGEVDAWNSRYTNSGNTQPKAVTA
jgi:hypothetical protein